MHASWAAAAVGCEHSREALAVRERRRVRRDTTVSVLGSVYELEQGFLAGRVVDVVYSYFDNPPQPEVEHEDKRYPLSLVDDQAASSVPDYDDEQPTPLRRRQA